jgi:nicotinamide-nucleotide amidase
MDRGLLVMSERLGEEFAARSMTLAIAESCTGGLIAAAITEIPGSSGWFDRGFVTYSNQAKIDLLGVKPETLQQFGAVSQETALEMASGALNNSRADWAVSVTGIAGPDGGSAEKPVGTVFVAWCSRIGLEQVERLNLTGGRSEIRQQTAMAVMGGLLRLMAF